MQNTVTEEIEVVDDPQLNVVFNASDRNLYKNSTRSFAATVTNNCPTEQEATNYTYSWYLKNGPAKILGTALSSITNKITLSDSFTEVGDYEIQVDVIGRGHTGNNTLIVHVHRRPLEVRLNRTSGQVSLKNSLTISAASSYDPDGGKLKFYWVCKNSQQQECRT